MTPLVIEIDLEDLTPPYEQIRDQVAAFIASERLLEGATLPSVRQLAGDLHLAPNTVVRAYTQLEQRGWIVAAPRRGFTVAGGSIERGREERNRQIDRAVARLAQTAQRLGVNPREVHAAIDRLYPAT